ncbi:MAG: transporter substrate-binding domain-containing protein [Thermotogae bacterium]|nr:transporter substrate-binding domain-containing protein [Thermotogota bacterium]
MMENAHGALVFNSRVYTHRSWMPRLSMRTLFFELLRFAISLRGFLQILGFLRCCLFLALVVLVLFTPIAGFTVDLRVGYYDNPPLCYEEDERVLGIFPELLSKIALKEGWEVEYERVIFSKGLERIRSGELDVLVAVAETPQRSEWSRFNEVTVVHNWGEVYVRPSSNIKDLEDLDGKTVGAVKGDVYYRALKELLSNFEVNVRFVEVEGDYPQVMRFVRMGEVDAGVVSRIFGQKNADKYGLRNLGLVISPVKLKYMFRRDVGEEIVSKVDSYLSEWKEDEDSIYYAVLAKYLGAGVGVSNRLLLYLLVIGAGVVGILLMLVAVLRKMVAARTRELEKEKEELFAANEELLAMNQQLEATQGELDLVADRLAQLIDLVNEMGERDISEEEFLRHLLDFALENVPEADYGSVWFIEDGRWKLVTAVGHDEERLKSLYLDKKYMYPAKGVEIVNIMEYDKVAMPPDIAKVFREATKPIKESMIASLKVGDDYLGNFALDIAEGSEKNFSDVSKRLMESLISLASAFLAMKRMVRLQGKFHKDLVRSLVILVELRDPYTKGHSERVAELASALAERLGLDRERVRRIYWAGLVHDVGKILVESSVLNKPGKLTNEERTQIEEHPVYGARVLEMVEGMEEIARIVLHHHEKWEGNGYPNGLRAEEIPLESRILAVVDAFDAMTSDRPYRKALSMEMAIEELRRCKGTQFDPVVVDAFIEMILSDDDFFRNPPELR